MQRISCNGQLFAWRRLGKHIAPEPQQRIAAHGGTINCIRFASGTGVGAGGSSSNPSSSLPLLITASSDRALKIWSTTASPSAPAPGTRKPAPSDPPASTHEPDILTCQRTLHGHTGGIKAFDCVGDLLVSVDIHGFVRLWHIPR